MDISPFFFYCLAAMAIGCSLLVVLMKNPVTAAFNLVLVFFSIAGLYVLMNAHLVAAMQILVYAGAVMVLFIFVLMLLNADTPSLDFQRSPVVQKILAPIFSLILLCLLVWTFQKSTIKAQGIWNSATIENLGGNTKVISQQIFSAYILPFELTSVLLLAAILGVVAVAMRKKKSEGPHG